MIILEALITHPKVDKVICIPEENGIISLTIFAKHKVRESFRTHQIRASAQLLFGETNNHDVAEMFLQQQKPEAGG